MGGSGTTDRGKGSSGAQGFMSTVPPYLRKDKDIQHLASQFKAHDDRVNKFHNNRNNGGSGFNNSGWSNGGGGGSSGGGGGSSGGGGLNWV